MMAVGAVKYLGAEFPVALVECRNSQVRAYVGMKPCLLVKSDINLFYYKYPYRENKRIIICM